MLGCILLEKELLVNAVGITLECERLPCEVRHQHWRNARVIIDDLALGESRFWVEHLVQVRQLQMPAIDFDILIRRQSELSNWKIR